MILLFLFLQSTEVTLTQGDATIPLPIHDLAGEPAITSSKSKAIPLTNLKAFEMTLKGYEFQTVALYTGLESPTLKQYLPCSGNQLKVNLLEMEGGLWNLRKGGFIHIIAAAEQGDKKGEIVLQIPSNKGLVLGDDLGVSLTLIDRWGDKQGAELQEGASLYYSISNLRSKRFRAIAQITLLDQDDEKDFELGIGTGFLFRPKGFAQTESGGLSFGSGVGYNMMIDEHDGRWFTFFAIGFSFD